MLKIGVSEAFLPEKTYILNVILREFLGVEYVLDVQAAKDYILVLENSKELIIRDMFFSLCEGSQGYLTQAYFPRRVPFVKNRFAPQADIPVIFGTDELTITTRQIVCGIDVFASSFFMLTRWEEYVNPTRDEHNRFPAAASVAYKHHFLHRPVVNEYVEMLWNMLQYLGIQQARKPHKFQVKPSHDIDMPAFYPQGLGSQVKTLAGDVLKRKSVSQLSNHLRHFSNMAINQERDPYNTFDFLLDESRKNHVTAEFYMKTSSKTVYDHPYKLHTSYFRKILKKIHAAQHILGFHPGYYSYNNVHLWKTEKAILDKVFATLHIPQATSGRQHYLNFEVPVTWQIWEDNEMVVDSTMGYAQQEGFRCGVCYEFPVFQILTRQTLHLKERPLIVMEGSFMKYQSELDFETIYTKIIRLKETIKRYNGLFTILTHNTTVSDMVWKGWRECYCKVIKT